MLTLRSVSKRFGGLQVLEDVSLEIPERGIFGLIGPNGAGKTTVFNLITGMLTPSSGAIEFDGRRVDGVAPYQIARQGVARTFQNIRLFKEMTLLENVLVALGDNPGFSLWSFLLPVRSRRRTEAEERERARDFLSRVGLAEQADRFAGALSYGEQRRLEIARALATVPKLLLLDEPAAGMNSAEKLLLAEEITKLSISGLSILIIEHDMRFIMGLCREITVLNFGRVIADGTPDEIRGNAAVIEAYLGSEGRAIGRPGARS
ncbi:MAG TPA: ABC transporter ATP-binding protein [Candidatus Binatia bacterium]|nr:ABC transporter ATP-binding protein [Candidatus Binatia bacterium]